jgi:hypothetical protein
MSIIFKSTYPILEACMNQGSTVELGIAVHNAGAYPSLCSWTYLGDYQKMRDDLDSLVLATGSTKIHLSFGLHEILKHSTLCYSMIADYKIPTVEVVYEELDDGPANLDELVVTALKPISDLGAKIFKRIRYPVSPEIKKKHLLDGVKKGALTEAQVEERFAKWLDQKAAKINAKKDGLITDAKNSVAAKFKAETASKEARSAKIAAKTAVAEAVPAVEETPVVEETPAADAPAENTEA